MNYINCDSPSVGAVAGGKVGGFKNILIYYARQVQQQKRNIKKRKNDEKYWNNKECLRILGTIMKIAHKLHDPSLLWVGIALLRSNTKDKMKCRYLNMD